MDKQKLIEKVYGRYKIVRIIYDKRNTFLNEQRINIIESIKKHGFTATVPKYPPLEQANFNMNEYWMDVVIFNLEKNIKIITERNEEMENFISDVKYFKDKYDLVFNEVILNKPQKNCQLCKASILSCNRHSSNAQHYKLFINRAALKHLNNEREIAIDVECVSRNPLAKEPNQSRSKIPFRVACVANVITKRLKQGLMKTRPEIVFHGFWYPQDRFKTFKPVVGITTTEIINNKSKFVNYEKGRREFFRHIVDKNILIFAGARDDCAALKLPVNTKVRDIQSYYYRYIDSYNTQPVSLRYLSRYVLMSEIQETEHDPVIDARNTLLLYNKIPEEFWNQEVERPIPHPIDTSADGTLISSINNYFNTDGEIPEPTTSGSRTDKSERYYIDPFSPNFNNCGSESN